MRNTLFLDRLLVMIVSVLVTSTSALGQYCIPGNTTPFTGDFYLTRVECQELSNVGTGGVNEYPYTNYSGIIAPAHLVRGGTYSLVVNAVAPSANGATRIAAYIDFDQNYTYYFLGDVLEGSSIGTQVISFYVPPSAVLGPTLLRVRVLFDSGVPQPCETGTQGETEDYTVIIEPQGGNPPVADFTSSATSIPVGGSVDFTDLSTNNPSEWHWFFTGGIPAESTEQNPQNVVFNDVGCHEVALVVDNAYGQSISTQPCYIQVSSSTASCTELFFSEYLEGSGNNKALEIYNPGSTAVDLSPYTVAIHTNGSTTPTNSYDLSGTLAAHAVIVLANSGSTADILAQADITSAVCQFNGDDALVLSKNSTVIDVFGEVGDDPGTYWPVGSSSSLDHTLVRQFSVDSPESAWVFSQPQWTSYSNNTSTYLGSHASTCGNATVIAERGEEGVVRLSPNPANGQVWVVLATGEPAAVQVLDALGRVVLEDGARKTGRIELNVENLVNGLYHIRILFQGQVRTMALQVVH